MLRKSLLSLGLLLMLLALSSPQPAATKPLGVTVPYFGFTPHKGGPGTVVQLTGGQYYNPDPFEIYFANTLTYPIQLRSKTLATVRADSGGNWTASITIPARWDTGELITETSIYIIATGNNQTAFSFTQLALPPTGRGEATGWVVIEAMLGLLTIISGTLLLARHESAS